MSKIIKRLQPEVIKKTAAHCRERGPAMRDELRGQELLNFQHLLEPRQVARAVGRDKMLACTPLSTYIDGDI